jgi:hypothetical protein
LEKGKEKILLLSAMLLIRDEEIISQCALVIMMEKPGRKVVGLLKVPRILKVIMLPIQIWRNCQRIRFRTPDLVS